MSKKFTMVQFEVQDGENTYHQNHIFFTSDFQKMNDCELIAYFYEGDKNINLRIESEGVYWLYDEMRTCFVRKVYPVGLVDCMLLNSYGVVSRVPKDNERIFKKKNNIVQFPKQAKHEKK